MRYLIKFRSKDTGALEHGVLVDVSQEPGVAAEYWAGAAVNRAMAFFCCSHNELTVVSAEEVKQ